MTRRCLPLVLSLLISIPAFAADQPPTGQAGSGATTVIHAHTDLVVVDVTVVDSHQSPVHQLTKDSFKIEEDGRPQTIRSFEEHVAPVSPPPVPTPKLQPGMFTNFTPVPESGPLDILLLDTLNTPVPDQAYARAQLLKYLKEAKPGTRVAVFGLGSHLYLIQGFTSDLDKLRTVLSDPQKTHLDVSPLLDSTVGGEHFNGGNMAGNDDMIDDIQAIGGGGATGVSMISNLKQFEADAQGYRLQTRIRYTLDALNQLGRFLGNLPGRKNLIWFSGSFPINVLPDPTAPDPFSVAANFNDEFRDTMTRLGRSQVAVYPVDAEGLRTDPNQTDENGGGSSAVGAGTIGAPASSSAPVNPLSVVQSSPAESSPNAQATSDMIASQQSFTEELANAHGTMKSMAESTGGRAFINTNDLTAAVRDAIAAGSNYYTITYVPSNPASNAFHKIKVDIDRKGLTLAYRRGYFTDDPNANHHVGDTVKSALGATAAPYNPFNAAMQHGAPEPAELLFLAAVRPKSNATEVALAPNNRLGPSVLGPFRTVTVRYSASAHDIQYTTTPDGAHHCAIEYAAMVYDSQGKTLNSATNAVKLDFPPAAYKEARDTGVQYEQQISLPVKGAFTVRVGMLDMNSGRVGSIEIPVSVIAKLPPATPTTATGTAPAPAPASGPAAPSNP
jgi:VWFA-related protein